MSTPDSATSSSQQVWPTIAFSALRVALGIIWAVIAVETWRPTFAAHLQHYNEVVFQSLSSWLLPWFGTWVVAITPYPTLFLVLARICTTLIALALLLGFARKTTYIAGALLSIPLWTLMEGYTSSQAFGTINLGAAVTYILVFISLLLIERANGTPPYSLDYYINHRWPSWRRFSEISHGADAPPRPEIKPLPWVEQVPIMLIIAAVLAFLISGSTSAINTEHQKSPGPLRVVARSRVATARDARLPPLASTGNSVDLHFVASHKTVEIVSGVYYQAWTFNGSAPAPTIHVRQGQTINVTFTNHSDMPHSIDFHAAMIAPSKAYVNITAGETVKFSFVAKVPGSFIYHCGTPPVLVHIGNGMYGAFIVDPIVPLPPADVSYVLVQSEWYTRLVSGTTMAGDYPKMYARTPDLVVFNGVAFQYADHPLPAKVGRRVRIYFVNAGPNLWSSFHVIGGIFEKVYPSGITKEALSGVSTYTVGPGEGDVFDIILTQAGNYTFVDHSMASMEVGAHGVLKAE